MIKYEENAVKFKTVTKIKRDATQWQQSEREKWFNPNKIKFTVIFNFNLITKKLLKKLEMIWPNGRQSTMKIKIVKNYEIQVNTFPRNIMNIYWSD